MTKTSPRRKALTALFSVLALVGVGGSVLAGQKTESTVSITVGATSSTASGALGTARASADTNQMISCTITGLTTANNVNCSARDAAGNFLSCTANSGAAFLAEAVGGIGPNSRLYFVVENATGKCTQINSTNGSQYKPVVP
jgi:hypothetical protein